MTAELVSTLDNHSGRYIVRRNGEYVASYTSQVSHRSGGPAEVWIWGGRPFDGERALLAAIEQWIEEGRP